MADYPSSVVNLATNLDGDTIFAAIVNSIQDEVEAIETGLLNGIQHDILPLTNNLHSLGSTSLRWAKVWTADLDVNGVLTLASATQLGILTPAPVTLTDGASVSLDASLGNVFLLTAAGNRTITAPTNATSGQKIIIEHKASGADRTLTLTTGSAGAFRFGTDITALTATTSALTDYIGCIYNAAANRWDVVAVVKGF